MSDAPPSLSVVIPAFNEGDNLSACVETLAATLDCEGTSYEILIVDDGSTDTTLEEARDLAGRFPGRIRIEVHGVNRGLGAALATGFAAARGRHVTLCPADFRMRPEDWAPFGSALGRADVIVGRRRGRAGYSLLMRFNAWLYARLVRALFGLDLGDVNWICVYPRDLIDRVTITQPGIPMLAEILVRLRDLGASFREVECRMQARTAGRPSAGRVTVMWRTLAGLISFWWTYHPPRRPASSPAPGVAVGADRS